MTIRYSDLNINPIAIQIGNLSIHWYGITYLFGLLIVYILGEIKLKNNLLNKRKIKNLEDLILYGMLGAIIGGRLGYVTIYKPSYFFTNPIEIFYLWEGGMSFHGGLIGVVISLFVYTKYNNIPFFETTDFIACIVPPAICLGRIGNFINGELWGYPTDLFFGVIFDETCDDLVRHPSQLYESILEGPILFTIMHISSKKIRKTGIVSSVFLIAYGLLRFVAELWREPDYFLGTVFISLSMGQILSILTVIMGLIIMQTRAK
ncbi:phosphatidylglycerol:prolipoprotein diacylglycerol transferase [Candidatus Kinetoplastibacterium blastocrithidii TCC012E]|uniref:Phosphatidylglycerol--prolipoprotein diacylglyceryl transferase n=1 Tax=Candidatus Kinetoplastidibacterium blastocrithidiae TCC012E TaxID=1208922 RepID=M1LC24_9PROT|nr:prolipoprotein diacylglyceryl transferase [Candidatus Kinetoplastibacterium blastocrithidii]AFZ83190.1 phosphatidylglycerol:prolipoprotein diacylglycerol transferase [Candidatus Kinetoplastibacterium blastocrithidii (ex Strigomonas culicis)]AGF50003.1 phosphatidylglycerol:prolipoprotein diacylglycerol transferase [Candidatus Kinetoplastibacterium blastocrithidii TCC012E]